MKQLKVSTIILMAVVLFAIVAVSGCTSSPTVTPTPTPAAATATPVPQTVALTINGTVDSPLALSMADLNKYANMSISTIGKNNTTYNATGVSMNKLLDDAKVNASAKNVTFIGSDGYNATLSLSVIRATPDAIIQYTDNGWLKSVVPGQATKNWVSKVIIIKVS